MRYAFVREGDWGMNAFKIYLDCIKKMKRAIGMSLLYDLLEGVLVVRTASFLGEFANAIFSMDASYALENIYYLLLCIGGYVLVLPALNFLLDYVCIKDGTHYTLFMNGLFFEKEYDKARVLSAGELCYRLEGDMISFYCFIIGVVCKVVVTPLVLAYLLDHALHINALYTLSALAISLLNFIVPLYVRHREARYDQETREYQEKVSAYVTEITTSPHVIRLFNINEFFNEKLDTLFWKYFSQTKKKDINCKTIAEQIAAFMKTLATLLIVLIGAIMVAKGGMQAGSILAMVGYLSLFETIMNHGSYIIKTVPKTKTLAKRLMFFYSDYEKSEGEPLEEAFSIKAADLGFSYPNGEKIMSHLNFAILSGTKTAICGKNGSGKTTLINLISGLRKNYIGSLKVNGVELSQISISQWHKHIGIARQNPYLFEGTVEENIRLGNLSTAESEINLLMRELGMIHLKGKQIHAGAPELSGGEKQKIAIARALLKESPILLLDEPHNNLDEKGLRWLKDFITHSDKTIIYISHLEDLTSLAENVIWL